MHTTVRCCVAQVGEITAEEVRSLEALGVSAHDVLEQNNQSQVAQDMLRELARLADAQRRQPQVSACNDVVHRSVRAATPVRILFPSIGVAVKKAN